MSEFRLSGTGEEQTCCYGTLQMNLVSLRHLLPLISLSKYFNAHRSQSDGHENPPSAPLKAYAFIKSLDPYHPISLCLNCENYYFESYSSGADIVLADVYPVGTNVAYSNKYQSVNPTASPPTPPFLFLTTSTIVLPATRHTATAAVTTADPISTTLSSTSPPAWTPGLTFSLSSPPPREPTRPTKPSGPSPRHSPRRTSGSVPLQPTKSSP